MLFRSEGVAEDAPEILEALGELWDVWVTLFPSRPRHPLRPFALTHHDLSPSNILVDPATYEVTGIIDWECTGARPGWECRYPTFLRIRYEVKGEPPPLLPEDNDGFRVEQWEDWENSVLRLSWDKELGNVDYWDDPADEMRLEWKKQLDRLKAIAREVVYWVRVEYEEWSSQQQAL